MLSLPYHLIVLAGALLAATLILEDGPTLTTLDVSPLWALPLLWLASTVGKLVEAHPQKRWLSLFSFAVPWVVFATFLWGTRWATWVFSLTDFKPIHDGNMGVMTAPLFAPLFIAHMGTCTPPAEARWKPFGNLLSPSWRVRTPLALWLIFFAFLCLSDTLLIPEAARAEYLVSPLWQFAQLLLSLVAAGFFASRILLLSLDLIPLERHLARRAESIAAAVGVARVRFYEWRTDYEINNAMVLVQPPRSWGIVFSDRFLDSIGPDEFEAVLAHELGHIRGGHVYAFVLWILGFSAGFLGLEALGLSGEGSAAWTISLTLFVALLLWIGFLSRRFELEADLYAAETKADGLARALINLTAFTGRQHKSGFRHFSTSRRVLFLRALQADPTVGLRLKADVRKLRRGGLVCFVLGVALLVGASLSTAETSEILVATQLGEYSRAAELLRTKKQETNTEELFGRAHFDRLIDVGVFLAGDRVALTGDDLAAEAEALLESDPTRESIGGVVPILDLAIMRSFGSAPGERHLRANLAIASQPDRDKLLAGDFSWLPELTQPWQRVAKAVTVILRTD